MGAIITSSYARRPYLTGFARGRCTTKSYKFKATSLCNNCVRQVATGNERINIPHSMWLICTWYLPSMPSHDALPSPNLCTENLSYLTIRQEARLRRLQPLITSFWVEYQSKLFLHPSNHQSDLVSGMTSPSSTQATLVLTAPKSTTQAFEIPAPYVAARDSCLPVKKT